jgi:peroxiredoxin
MHIGKDLEAHQVEKGHLSCDSEAPQVGSTWPDSTRVVKVNRHKVNDHKTRPYCTSIFPSVSLRQCPVPIQLSITKTA